MNRYIFYQLCHSLSLCVVILFGLHIFSYKSYFKNVTVISYKYESKIYESILHASSEITSSNQCVKQARKQSTSMKCLPINCRLCLNNPWFSFDEPHTAAHIAVLIRSYSETSSCLPKCKISSNLEMNMSKVERLWYERVFHSYLHFDIWIGSAKLYCYCHLPSSLVTWW